MKILVTELFLTYHILVILHEEQINRLKNIYAFEGKIYPLFYLFIDLLTK